MSIRIENIPTENAEEFKSLVNRWFSLQNFRFFEFSRFQAVGKIFDRPPIPQFWSKRIPFCMVGPIIHVRLTVYKKGVFNFPRNKNAGANRVKPNKQLFFPQKYESKISAIYKIIEYLILWMWWPLYLLRLWMPFRIQLDLFPEISGSKFSGYIRIYIRICPDFFCFFKWILPL